MGRLDDRVVVIPFLHAFGGVERLVAGLCRYLGELGLRHTRAGRLTRIDGRNVLRLTANPATEQLYEKVAHGLAV